MTPYFAYYDTTATQTKFLMAGSMMAPKRCPTRSLKARNRNQIDTDFKMERCFWLIGVGSKWIKVLTRKQGGRRVEIQEGAIKEKFVLGDVGP